MAGGPMEPLVTIGIPNYNYGRFLRQCVESALAQDHAAVEVLVSDNASTDDSCEVLASFTDPRLRWWRNEGNVGVFPNWDKLLAAARGRYVKILQADDWLEPGFVSGCLEAMDRTGADHAMTGFRFAGAREGEERPALGGPAFAAPGRGAVAARLWDLTRFVQPTPTLFHRDLVPEGYGGGSENMCRDFVYWSKALIRGRPVLVDRVLAVQRIHPGQDRRRRDNSRGLEDLLAGVDVLRALEPHGAGPALDEMERHFSGQFLRSAGRHLLHGRWVASRRILSELRRRRLLGPAAYRAAATALGTSRDQLGGATTR